MPPSCTSQQHGDRQQLVYYAADVAHTMQLLAEQNNKKARKPDSHTSKHFACRTFLEQWGLKSTHPVQSFSVRVQLGDPTGPAALYLCAALQQLLGLGLQFDLALEDDDSTGGS